MLEHLSEIREELKVISINKKINYSLKPLYEPKREIQDIYFCEFVFLLIFNLVL